MFSPGAYGWSYSADPDPPTMTRSELRDLYDLADDYCDNTFSVCKWVYRDKPEVYFDDIFDEECLMSVVTKDNGGDPRSPINGRLKGLFFMANNVDGKPPPYSYFGNRRFQVPPRVLFDVASNVYFADFYCLQGRRHYVTLVLAKPHSRADKFCRRRLIPVDEDDNPFYYWDDDDRLYVNDTDYFHVELFHTRDIDVIDLVQSGTARLKYVETKGHGSSTPGGIPKNSLCTVCNL